LSGGHYLREDAEVRLYGVQGDRTLRIVGAGSQIAAEPRLAGGSRPKAGQGRLDEAFGRTESKGGTLGKTTTVRSKAA
jgi:hypothetical protein